MDSAEGRIKFAQFALGVGQQAGRLRPELRGGGALRVVLVVVGVLGAQSLHRIQLSTQAVDPGGDVSATSLQRRARNATALSPITHPSSVRHAPEGGSSGGVRDEGMRHNCSLAARRVRRSAASGGRQDQRAASTSRSASTTRVARSSPASISFVRNAKPTRWSGSAKATWPPAPSWLSEVAVR